jgi:hypothetical protein
MNQTSKRLNSVPYFILQLSMVTATFVPFATEIMKISNRKEKDNMKNETGTHTL